jgi:RNA polymerase sigma-70 factor (ECF subfamily)
MALGERALSSLDLSEPIGLEAGWLERSLEGDAEAFGHLVRLHEGMVFNLAARLLGDLDEARDLAQDVFLQIHKSLHRFEGRSSLKTWIYRIVVNQCRNRRRFWRRRRRERCTPLQDLSPRDHAKLVAGDAPDLEVARRERSEIVPEALLVLSFEHRSVLLLREVEGLSCEEIGRTLGVAPGTVKSRLARARDKLRCRLLETAEKGVRP